MRQRIKIYDRQFAHTPDSSFGGGDLMVKPTYFDWYRGQRIIGDVAVITEGCFHQLGGVKELIKIALLIEPFQISSVYYNWIAQHYKLFDYVLTHNKWFAELFPNCIYYPFGGCWIKPKDRNLHKKTKDVSIIASGKRDTVGQLLRHEVIERFKGRFDVYGRGYNPVENKIEALRDYKYTIVIENEATSGWFTEKLNDAFATGTIPIYYGDPDVCQMFNCSGMFRFSNLTELENILHAIELKEADLLIFDQAVIDNFEKSQKYYIPEDWMYLNFFKPKELLR